jgi:Flp pilus assembly protein TadG
MNGLVRRESAWSLSRRSQRGTSAVEFALVLPIFLFILFGLIELSVALYDKAVITNASREGARAGVVLRNPKLSAADIEQVVLKYTSSTLINFGANSTPVVTVIQSSPASAPNPLTVTVSYTYSGLGLGALMSAIQQPVVISATSVMINE